MLQYIIWLVLCRVVLQCIASYHVSYIIMLIILHYVMS